MDRKIFWKFNIIDIILIAIIIISVVVLIYRTATTNENDEASAYLFTYICPSAPNEALDGITTGLSCSDGEYGNTLGQLTSVNISETEEDPDSKKATFITLINGKAEEHGVSVEDVLYLKGKELSLIIGDSVFKVYLSGIQPLN